MYEQIVHDLIEVAQKLVDIANKLSAMSNGTTTPAPAPVPAPVPTPPPTHMPLPDPVPTASFYKTMVLPVWEIGAAPHKHLYTANAGHFGINDIFVISITTPPTLGTDCFGSLSWSDVGSDPPAQRRVVLSDEPGRFDLPLPSIGGTSTVLAANGSLHFSAGPNTVGYPALMIPNHTYYFNIENINASSPTGHVDLDIEFSTPKVA
jgi:hypothetical protein